MSSVIHGVVQEDELSRPKYGNLPALPEVTFRILSLAKDPDSTPAELQKLISSDIAMSTRILKVVNSVFYGLPRQIGTIDRAVVVLGRNAVRNIAVAASMVKIFNSGTRGDAGGLDTRRLWLHSTATAMAARLISEQVCKGDANELFLAGLTHDIGLMAEVYWAQHKLLMCVRDLELDQFGTPQRDLRDVEQKWFGVDHATLGREVCEYWNFPDVISSLVGLHHDPWSAPDEHRQMAGIIRLADLVAAGMPDGFRLDHTSLDIDAEILDELKVTPYQIAQFGEQLRTELHEVANILG